MKKRMWAVVVCLCLMLALLPAGVLASDGVEQMQFAPAILHDASGTYEDGALCDEGSYQMTSDITGSEFTITAANLKSHENAQGTMGYWAGVAVVAPASATQVKAAVSQEAVPSLDGVEASPLEPRVNVADGVEYDGISFYADASQVKKIYCAVQWLDGQGNVITYTDEMGTDEVYTFSVDFSGVTLAQGQTGEPEEEPEEAMPFTDAVGHWAQSAIQYVYEKGMMNGITATTFEPDSQLTRGMIVTILYRLEGEPEVSGASFADVDSGAYYAAPVAWAVENGIVTGYNETAFGPQDDITREQLATILHRYASFKGYDTASSESLSGFADSSQVSEYALSGMNWAVEQGLINGVTDTALQPAGTATRAQVAAILMRFCENAAQ